MEKVFIDLFSENCVSHIQINLKRLFSMKANCQIQVQVHFIHTIWHIYYIRRDIHDVYSV